MQVAVVVVFTYIVRSQIIAYVGSDSMVPKTLLAYAFNLSAVVSINNYKTADQLIIEPPINLLLVLDDTQTEISNSVIKDFGNSNNVPVIVLSSGDSSEWIYYIKPSYQCTIKSLNAVLTYFNFTEVALTTNFYDSNQYITDELKRSFYTRISTIAPSLKISKSELSNMFGKVFKASGAQRYVFLSHSSLCALYSEAFQSAYLEKEGSIAVYLNECIYQVKTNGTLIIATPISVNSLSYYDYIIKHIGSILLLFSSLDVTKIQIRNEMNRISNKCLYSLINIKNSQKIVVGSIDNGILTFNNSLVYFGGKNQTTNFVRPQIMISANTGSLNPPPFPNAYQNENYQHGTYYGVAKVNREKIYFPAYDLILYDKVNCGVTVFDANYSKACFLKHINSMGSAYIPTINAVTISVLQQFKSLKISMPFVGGVGISDGLSNKTTFPTFTRIVSPSSYFASSWTNLLQIYGWKNIIVFYTNDNLGKSAYDIILQSSILKGFNILNNETERIVTPIGNSSSLANYSTQMRNAINTGCNIFFLIMSDPSPFYWLEGLYDVGVRRGDIVIVFFSLTGVDSLTLTGANYTKRAELMHGSFVIYNAAWMGEYGESVKTDYLKYESSTWGRSFFIDAVLTISHTIDFLLTQGKFFENSTEFMTAQRNVRIEGCTGVISFDKSSNNRNLYFFNLYNFYQNSSGDWFSDPIALISPVSNVYYTILQEPVWPGGVFPTDMKLNYSNCPFRESQIVDSSIGKQIKIVVCVGILILATALTIYTSIKINYSALYMLSSKTFATVQDYLVLLFIIIEAFQAISIGPSFSSFNTLLSNLTEYLSLNLSKSVSFKDTIFWIVFYLMLVISYAWILILILTALPERFCSRLFFRLKSLKEFSIPILSNYLFIPVVMSILSIVSCDYATGSDLTDSYLNYDCNQKCWGDDHIKKVVPAALLIAAYIPLAILYRTVWQESNTHINIRSNSVYLIVKNLAFVFVIIIRMTLKSDYPLVHSIVYSLIIASLTLYVFYIKTPFNFDRANVWAKLMLCCVLWNSIICISEMSSHNSGALWLSLQLVGWACLLISGIVIIKKLPPSLIVTKQGRSIVQLFRFAFGLEEIKSIYTGIKSEIYRAGDSIESS